MPNNMIKKDEKRGYGTEKKLENDWDEAKDAAGKGPGGKTNYALTNYIYQKKKKHASIQPTEGAIMKINAATRLKATTQVNAGWIDTEFLPLFNAAEKKQIAKWISEQHPDLDDDVKLRDKLYSKLKTELELQKTPEPYNAIAKFLKTKLKGKV